MALPCSSVTVPRTEPVSVCANSVVAKHRVRTNQATANIPYEYARNRFIASPLVKRRLDKTGPDTHLITETFRFAGQITFISPPADFLGASSQSKLLPAVMHY